MALVRNVELFPGTVLDNLRLGRDDLTHDEVTRALEGVGLLDELLTMPRGSAQSCIRMAGRCPIGRRAG